MLPKLLAWSYLLLFHSLHALYTRGYTAHRHEGRCLHKTNPVTDKSAFICKKLGCNRMSVLRFFTCNTSSQTRVCAWKTKGRTPDPHRHQWHIQKRKLGLLCGFPCVHKLVLIPTAPWLGHRLLGRAVHGHTAEADLRIPDFSRATASKAGEAEVLLLQSTRLGRLGPQWVRLS